MAGGRNDSVRLIRPWEIGVPSIPSEFTLESATIFSSSLDPVFRACLAQLRVSARGAYWMEQGVAPEVLADASRIPGRLGSPPAPSRDGAALDGWTWTG